MTTPCYGLLVRVRQPAVRLGVLASGGGSIFRALLEAALPIVILVTDRPCGAETIAEEAGIRAERLARSSFGADFDRAGYTAELVALLNANRVDLVAMAGFGTILGPAAHAAFPRRIVNTHPALLPAFKGWHAVEEALAAGATETGCTVHLATTEVDDGPILAAEAVEVRASDTVETLHERIKQVERRLYPETLWELVRTLEQTPTAPRAAADR